MATAKSGGSFCRSTGRRRNESAPKCTRLVGELYVVDVVDKNDFCHAPSGLRRAGQPAVASVNASVDLVPRFFPAITR